MVGRGADPFERGFHTVADEETCASVAKTLSAPPYADALTVLTLLNPSCGPTLRKGTVLSLPSLADYSLYPQSDRDPAA